MAEPTVRQIDQQLVERAQRGDKKAFEVLVMKYQRKLARLLSRFVRDPAEVEDVTQEAFIKAYRALPSFRGDSAFYTWLYRIGINTAKNYLVALGRRARLRQNSTRKKQKVLTTRKICATTRRRKRCAVEGNRQCGEPCNGSVA
jgi:RNA polymerase sigma factor (sigma-70 family)